MRTSRHAVNRWNIIEFDLFSKIAQRERRGDVKERELTDEELEAVVDIIDIDRFSDYLQPMLVRRFSGSAALAGVRQVCY